MVKKNLLAMLLALDIFVTLITPIYRIPPYYSIKKLLSGTPFRNLTLSISYLFSLSNV